MWNKTVDNNKYAFLFITKELCLYFSALSISLSVASIFICFIHSLGNSGETPNFILSISEPIISLNIFNLLISSLYCSGYLLTGKF